MFPRLEKSDSNVRVVGWAKEISHKVWRDIEVLDIAVYLDESLPSIFSRETALYTLGDCRTMGSRCGSWTLVRGKGVPRLTIPLYSLLYKY